MKREDYNEYYDSSFQLGRPIIGQQSLSDATGIAEKNYKVFFLTAPHDQLNRGDTAYVRSILTAFNQSNKFFDYAFDYITGDSKLKNSDTLYNITKLYENLGKGCIYSLPENLVRQNAVGNIIKYIQEQSQGFKFKILHLQLREPETGCLMHINDFNKFREIVDAIVITCHEWGYYTSVSIQPQYLVKQLNRIKLADHAIFLNQIDKDEAIKFSQKESNFKEEESQEVTSFRNKSSVSNVIATLPTELDWDIEKRLNVPNNILIFGLIRPKKGFEKGLEIVNLIKNLQEHSPISKTRIIYAAKPHDSSLLRKLLVGKFKDVSLLKSIFENTKIISSKVDEYLRKLRIIKLKEFIDNLIVECNCNKEIKEQIELIYNKDYKLGIKGENIAKILRDNGSIHDDIKEIEKNGKLINYLNFELKLSPLVKDNYTNAYLVEAYNNLTKDQKLQGLAIDFYFDVDEKMLNDLAYDSKYCIKIEDKGFANNSSSIINMLSRGLITFTNETKMTSKDFKSGGRFQDAIVIISIDEKAESIIKIIEDREFDQKQTTNRKTLKDLKLCINELFTPEKVSNDHFRVYTNLIRGGLNERT